MKPSAHLVAIGVLCLLPAIQLGSAPVLAEHPGSPARGLAPVLPSFLPACEPLPPRTQFFPSGETQPTDRARDANVEVFLAGQSPAREHTVLGEVEVLARSHRTSLNNLLDSARREARKHGGDALMEVRPRAVSSAARAPLVLTAKVVRWS